MKAVDFVAFKYWKQQLIDILLDKNSNTAPWCLGKYVLTQ